MTYFKKKKNKKNKKNKPGIIQTDSTTIVWQILELKLDIHIKLSSNLAFNFELSICSKKWAECCECYWAAL